MRLLRSICRALGFSQRQHERVNGGLERAKAVKTASQMTCRDEFLSDLGGTYCNEGIGDYLENRNASIDKARGDKIEIDEGRIGVADDLERLVRGLGVGSCDLSFIGAHRSILLTVGDDGQAYDAAGVKWSRAS